MKHITECFYWTVFACLIFGQIVKLAWRAAKPYLGVA